MQSLARIVLLSAAALAMLSFRTTGQDGGSATSAPALPVPESCSECRMQGSDALLCARHKEDEASAIALWNKAFTPKAEEGDCAAALRAVAAAAAHHANAASASAAKAIAKGLEACPAPWSRRIQTEAARMLAHSHPEVATKSLCAAVGELCKELEKDRDAYKAYWQNQKLVGFQPDETANEAMKQFIREVEEKRIRALDERDAYLAVLCESLGRFRDDRSVDALARVLARPLRTRSRAAVDSLLSLASRDAVKSVVDALAGCEEVRKELSKEADGSAISTDLREWGAFVDERLRAFAKAREIEHPQAKAEVPYAEWRTWSVKALAGLPKSLGRVPVVPSAHK